MYYMSFPGRTPIDYLPFSLKREPIMCHPRDTEQSAEPGTENGNLLCVIPVKTGIQYSLMPTKACHSRAGVSSNAVNFSPWVARSNLFGRVGMHFSPEIEIFSSHTRNNHLTLYEKSDYENIAIKKFTALRVIPVKTGIQYSLIPAKTCPSRDTEQNAEPATKNPTQSAAESRAANPVFLFPISPPRLRSHQAPIRNRPFRIALLDRPQILHNAPLPPASKASLQ